MARRARLGQPWPGPGENMTKWMLQLAAWYGGTAVVLGALGAHGLKARLGAGGLEIWQTGVLYHLVHAAVLLATGLWLLQRPHWSVEVAGGLLAPGTLLFSGSSSLLALGGPRRPGPSTPPGWRRP